MVFSLFFGRRNTACRTTRSNRVDKKRKHTKRLRLERLENRSLLAGFPIGIGGTGSDDANSIVTDVSGNVFVAGRFQNTVDFDPGTTTANLTSNYSGKSPTNTSDGFLAKYRPDGTFLWARRFGGTGVYDFAESVVLDPAGNAYLAGSFQGTTTITGVNAGGATYSNNVLMDSGGSKGGVSSKAAALVIKFDPAGGVSWAKQFGGEASAKDVAIDTNTSGDVVGVYVVGDFLNTVDFNPNPNLTDNLTSRGVMDNFVVKLNGAGNFEWATRGGSTGWDYSSGIAVGADGNTYVTGRFEGTAQFGSSPSIVSIGNADGFVAKLSSNGDWIWATRMGGADYDVVRDVSVLNSSVYITGAFFTASGGASFGPDTLIGGGGQDAFISKLGSDGNFVWTKQFGGLGRQDATDVAISPNEDIYVTGHFQETVDFNPGDGYYPLSGPLITAGNGSVTNAFVTKLDANGNFGGWAQRFGSTSASSYARSVFWDTASSLFVAGGFAGSGSFLPPSNKGGSDAFVVKLNPSTGSSISSLLAAAPAPMAVSESLSLSQVSPIFDAALAKWQATGADVSSLLTTDIRVADLGGSLLGLASGNTITLDDNAAGWGWYIDSTPSDDSEFLDADNHGEMHRMDLLSVLIHEMGHLLGHDHDDEGVMAEALEAGTRGIELEQVHVAATDLAFGWQPDFETEFSFEKAKRRK